MTFIQSGALVRNGRAGWTNVMDGEYNTHNPLLRSASRVYPQEIDMTNPQDDGHPYG